MYIWVMDEPFSITVVYRDNEYTFDGYLVTVGYTHRFCVILNGLEVTYEPDEERNYRAILNEADQAKVKDTEIELIKAVGDKIQELW